VKALAAATVRQMRAPAAAPVMLKAQGTGNTALGPASSRGTGAHSMLERNFAVGSSYQLCAKRMCTLS
jgi:hypothetical protein